MFWPDWLRWELYVALLGLFMIIGILARAGRD